MITGEYRKTIFIPIENIKLEGELVIPLHCKSLVIFSHGSGSSRFSPRNNFVAKTLHKQCIGTFLFDLLTEDENAIYENRFNIRLLTNRLISATKYIANRPQCSKLNIGYFGASTGSASALGAAVELPEIIGAFVSRGGRPDLAINLAPKLKAPTRLIVGENDAEVLKLNNDVYKLLTCEKKFEIIPNATHLFEEPGKLNEVALLAADWFNIFLQNKKEKAAIN